MPIYTELYIFRVPFPLLRLTTSPEDDWRMRGVDVGVGNAWIVMKRGGKREKGKREKGKREKRRVKTGGERPYRMAKAKEMSVVVH